MKGVCRDDISDLASKSNIYQLKELRLSNTKNFLFAYPNVTFIKNKFENLFDLLTDKFDVLTIAEIKLDVSGPTYQFLIKGFHPFRLDINRNRGVVGNYIYQI